MTGKDLDDLIYKYKMSKVTAAERLGITRATLYNWISKDILDIHIELQIREAFKIGDEIKTEISNYSPIYNKATNSENRNIVPYFDLVATASSPKVEVWSDNNGHPTSYMDIGHTMPKAEAIIRVSGNSMTPGYPSGCLIGLRKINDSLFDYGAVYVLETADNRFLKRIFKGKDDNHIQCYSDNTMVFQDGPRKGKLCYEPFELPIDKIKRVFKVVGSIKHNDHSYIP